MARIIIHRRPFMKIMYLPQWVFINGQPVGMMHGENATVELPEGTYNISVKLLFQIWKLRFGLEGSRIVTVSDSFPMNLRVTDRERIWNTLFDIDLVVWFASLFFTLPSPWNLVYHVLSDGFFILWIARLIAIRKHYYKLVEK